MKGIHRFKEVFTKYKAKTRRRASNHWAIRAGVWSSRSQGSKISGLSTISDQTPQNQLRLRANEKFKNNALVGNTHKFQNLPNKRKILFKNNDIRINTVVIETRIYDENHQTVFKLPFYLSFDEFVTSFSRFSSIS